jgi:type I restriction enzyme, S subunit
MSSAQVPEGYKQTEVGVIPEDWEAKILGEILKIGNGFSFKGDFFSPSGPIVLTPGNFKLEGGLYFNDRNTKRYSGDFPEWTIFKKGDLLVVMTDLTPDCNLLGKPAFIDSDEIILHNQRIGKVNLLSKDIDKRFLYFLLLSSTYLNKIKEQVTGSTVRHTSNKSIYCVALPIPQKIEEQRSLAQALSDVDALIASLDKLIAKQRHLKTAAMQQLLTDKTRLPGFDGEWEVKSLGELAHIQRGASPRPIDSPRWFDENSSVGWVRISDVTRSGMYLFETNQKLSPLGIQHSRPVIKNSLIMSICATVGRPIITEIDVCIHDGFVVFDNLQAEKLFIYYVLKWLEPGWSKQGQTGSQMNLNTELINGTAFRVPPLNEQRAIATVLSDMDTAIAALETRRSKTQAIKQGMMQELLTGRTRLV